MPDALFDLITVHCIACEDHAESGLTPQAAHDAMEAHYAAVHGWCGHSAGWEPSATVCFRGRGRRCVRLMHCKGAALR